jgi:hypothetical protein
MRRRRAGGRASRVESRRAPTRRADEHRPSRDHCRRASAVPRTGAPPHSPLAALGAEPKAGRGFPSDGAGSPARALRERKDARGFRCSREGPRNVDSLFGNGPPRPRCRRGSPRGWVRAPTPDGAQVGLAAAERREAPGALAGDESLETGPDDGGFFADARELSGFLHQTVVKNEGCSHMHKYGRSTHIRQAGALSRPGSPK